MYRERYGARGQALGLSKNRGRSLDSTNDIGEEEGGEGTAALDEVLNEFYIFLIKESNIILNSVYTETLIDRDSKEFDSTTVIDDEVETPMQMFKRLLKRAMGTLIYMYKYIYIYVYIYI
jgi:hypothetical protein